MTGLQILHWSDLHFAGARVGSQLEPARAIHLAVEAVQRDFGAQQFLLAISGDITTAGLSSGYDAARDALTAAGKALNLVKIVVCPGNHDIGNLNPRSFTAFNRFALQVTGDADQAWDFANPVRTLRAGDHEILSVNTSYLGDHRVGSAPLAALRVALRESKGPHRIVLLHHSPISSGYAGGGMADAYELL